MRVGARFPGCPIERLVFPAQRNADQNQGGILEVMAESSGDILSEFFFVNSDADKAAAPAVVAEEVVCSSSAPPAAAGGTPSELVLGQLGSPCHSGTRGEQELFVAAEETVVGLSPIRQLISSPPNYGTYFPSFPQQQQLLPPPQFSQQQRQSLLVQLQHQQQQMQFGQLDYRLAQHYQTQVQAQQQQRQPPMYYNIVRPPAPRLVTYIPVDANGFIVDDVPRQQQLYYSSSSQFGGAPTPTAQFPLPPPYSYHTLRPPSQAKVLTGAGQRYITPAQFTVPCSQQYRVDRFPSPALFIPPAVERRNPVKNSRQKAELPSTRGLYGDVLAYSEETLDEYDWQTNRKRSSASAELREEGDEKRRIFVVDPFKEEEEKQSRARKEPFRPRPRPPPLNKPQRKIILLSEEKSHSKIVREEEEVPFSKSPTPPPPPPPPPPWWEKENKLLWALVLKFGGLNRSQLACTCTSVCKIWRNIVRDDLAELWSEVDVNGRQNVAKCEWDCIGRLKPHTLNLSEHVPAWTGISKSDLMSVLVNNERLQSLSLSGCHFSAVMALKMVKSNRLHSLDLRWVQGCNDASLKELIQSTPTLKTLHQLFLSGCDVGDATARLLANQFRQLRVLDLSHCPKVTNLTLDALSAPGSLARRHLNELILAGCMALEPSIFAQLQRLPVLAKLDLNGCPKVSRHDCLEFEQATAALGRKLAVLN